jgi:tRNA(adenine34) deaminase
MRLALRQAAEAAEAGDVPIGAVIVRQGRIIGQAHNQVELLKDPTAHAEIIAITQAANALGDWRLDGATLYVTKEPCPMCRHALRLARVARVVFGAPDPQTLEGFPPPSQTAGVLEAECREQLQRFFRRLRKG